MDAEADHSILIDNPLAHENLADNQISASHEGNRKRRSNQAASLDQAESSKAKRKLELDDIEDCTNSPPTVISNEVPVLVAESQEDDHDDLADFALVAIEGIPKPLPFIDPSIPLVHAAGESSHDQSELPSNTTQIYMPAVEASEINAYINGNFLSASFSFFLVHYMILFRFLLYQLYVTC